MAIGLGAAFLVLGLANLFSGTAFVLALVLIIVQNLWIVAAAVTMAAGRRPSTEPVGQAA